MKTTIMTNSIENPKWSVAFNCIAFRVQRRQQLQPTHAYSEALFINKFIGECGENFQFATHER